LVKILLLNFSLVNGYEIIRAKFNWFKKAKRDTQLTLQGYKEKGKKFLLAIILFYLIRDLILYVIIPGLIFFSVCGN